MAQGVMKVTRLLANNPRRITLEDAERIYRQCLVKNFLKFRSASEFGIQKGGDTDEA